MSIIKLDEVRREDLKATGGKGASLGNSFTRGFRFHQDLLSQLTPTLNSLISTACLAMMRLAPMPIHSALLSATKLLPQQYPER